MRVVNNSYTTVCPHVRVIIHSLKFVDYLLAQADNHGITKILDPWLTKMKMTLETKYS